MEEITNEKVIFTEEELKEIETLNDEAIKELSNGKGDDEDE